MTTEQRAEKIKGIVERNLHIADKLVIDGIAAEIRAAVFESKDGTDMQNAYTLGKLSAFEEAAKILDKYATNRYSSCCGIEAENAAAEIRSKATELK